MTILLKIQKMIAKIICCEGLSNMKVFNIHKLSTEAQSTFFIFKDNFLRTNFRFLGGSVVLA